MSAPKTLATIASPTTTTNTHFLQRVRNSYETDIVSFSPVLKRSHKWGGRTHRERSMRVDALNDKRLQPDHQRRQRVHLGPGKHRVVIPLLRAAPLQDIADRDPKLNQIEREDEAHEGPHGRLFAIEASRGDEGSHHGKNDAGEKDVDAAASGDGTWGAG